MERGKRTDFILKQFKRKSKRVVNKDYFTEFFYLNRERSVIEFLKIDGELIMDKFLKEFLPSDFREFVEVKVINDVDEPIKTWFYDEENISIIIGVNWGINKQQITIEVDVENFAVTVVDQQGMYMRRLDYQLLNDFLISFLTTQARTLAETFDTLSKKK